MHDAQEKPEWDAAKRLLGDSNFIRRLVEFERDTVPEKVSRTLKRVISDPQFTPDQVSGCAVGKRT
jgi:dynein heavy chain